MCSSSEDNNDARMPLVGTYKTNIGMGPALIHKWGDFSVSLLIMLSGGLLAHVACGDWVSEANHF